MATLTVLDEVQAKWELAREMAAAKSGPSIHHWKKSPDGSQPVREKAPQRADVVRKSDASNAWEVYDNGVWKGVVTVESLCRDVILAWNRRPSKAQKRDEFAIKFSRSHSGATKADVMSVLRLLGNREYNEEEDVPASLNIQHPADEAVSAPTSPPSPTTHEQNIQEKDTPRPTLLPLQFDETIDKSLVGPDQDEIERREWTGLATPDSSTKSSQFFSNSRTPESGASTPVTIASSNSAAEQKSTEPSEYPAQDQQDRLFNDPRRHQLLEEYAENCQRFPTSHLSSFGYLAHYIFDNGRPPRIWTCGGEGTAEVGLDPTKPSVHGKCKWSYDEADVLLLTEAEHAAWAKANNPPKLVILRDEAFAKRRPAKTTETWLNELSRIPKSRNVRLDIQRLNRPVTEPAVDSLSIHEALEQWNNSRGARILSDNPPVNVLNISDNMPGSWPEGLTKEYQLLFDAISVCDGVIYRSLDQELNLNPDEAGLGKPTLMAFSPTDIQKCTQFRILAQRGAISSWHVDNVGVYTFVMLEGNVNSPTETSEDVVKYWPVFPMYNLSPSEADQARAEFGKYGINWRPTPADKIPVLALTRGDMLIQPPGTIHAPITLTDCFFLGGMCWRPSTTRLSIDTWHYLTKHPICTNEPLPKQTHMILDYLREVVHESPVDFGFDPSRPDELAVFDLKCDEICGTVVSCRCAKGCSLSSKCSCMAHGLRCGIYCHPGIAHDACKELAASVAAAAAAARSTPRSGTPRATSSRKRSKKTETRNTPSVDDTENDERPSKLIKVESQDEKLDAVLGGEADAPGELDTGSEAEMNTETVTETVAIPISSSLEVIIPSNDRRILELKGGSNDTDTTRVNHDTADKVPQVELEVTA